MRGYGWPAVLWSLPCALAAFGCEAPKVTSPDAPHRSDAAPTALSCTASDVDPADAGSRTITFDEPAVAATWAGQYGFDGGSYATCPYSSSPNLTTFTVNGVTFTGDYGFRSLYLGCQSDGTLQTFASSLLLAFERLPPSRVQLTMGTDGSFPDPRFDMVATAANGASTTITTDVRLPRTTLEVICSMPLASLKVMHDGPNWILDLLAF